MYQANNGKYCPFIKIDDSTQYWRFGYYNSYIEDEFCYKTEYKLDLSQFDTIDIHLKQLNYPDEELEFRKFNFSSLFEEIGRKFRVGFELGNEIIITNEYPRLKHFGMCHFSFTEKRENNFRKQAFIRNSMKIGYDSYQKMAEEELRDLDDRFPEWSMGVWE
ncbi:MAG TPA: hypothetical protein VFM79_05300 [Pelobium sp.]|nr:hypothetical protein [Pelobium sp.]